MSRTIDERIVEMSFDNDQFNDGISESMTLIEKFQNLLRFDKVSTGFDSIQNAADRLNFHPITAGLDAVSGQFSVMQTVAFTTISNITTRLESEATKWVKAFSIDQLTTGWSKYESTVESVQTIMSATGKSMDEVSGYVSELNWFADETSYSLSDMMSAVSKFTGAGVELEEAIPAIEGIATWAAFSGVNANRAAGAFYNLSQAMGAGALKLQDWKSVEMLNMTTPKFRQVVLDNALALGKLEKAGEEAGKTLYKVKGASKDKAFTMEGMGQSLSEGWLDKEVLMSSLNAFGGYAHALYDVADGYDTCAEAMEHFEWTQKDYGKEAFMRAQEAKTLSDAIDATKEAVSTGWMQTFEYIFGNYKEATVLWTEVCGILWDVFAAGGAARNEMLKMWHDKGGRQAFLDGWKNIYEYISSVTDVIGKKFQRVFKTRDTERNAKKLLSITDQFKNWTSSLELTKRQIARLGAISFHTFRSIHNIMTGVVRIFKTLGKFMQDTFGLAFKNQFDGVILTTLRKIMKSVRGVTADFKNFAKSFQPSTRSVLAFYGIFSNLFKIVKNVGSAIGDFATTISTAYETAIDRLKSSGFDFNFDFGLFDAAIGIKNFLKELANLDFSMNFTEHETNLLALIFADLIQIFAKMGGVVKDVVGVVKDVGKAFGDAFKAIFGVKIENPFEAFERGHTLYAIKKFLDNVLALNLSFELTEETAGKLQKIFEGVFAVFDILGQAISAVVEVLFPGIGHGAESLSGPFGTVISLVTDAAGGIVDFISKIAEFIVDVDKKWKENDTLKKGMQDAIDKITGAYDKFNGVIEIATQKIGEWAAKVDEAYKKITGKSISETIDEIKASFSRLFDSFSGFSLSGAFMSLGDFLNGIFSAFRSVKEEGQSSGIDWAGIWQTIVEQVTALQPILNGIKSIFVGLWDVVKSVAPLIGWLADGFGQILSKIGEGISEFIDKVSFVDALSGTGKLINMGVLVSFAKSFADLVKTIWEAINGFGSGEEGNVISNIISSVTDTLSSMQEKLKSDALKSLALSIAILTGSLWILSSIDPSALGQSLAIVATSVGGLIYTMKQLTESMSTMDAKEMEGLGKSLLMVSGAVLVMSLAFKVFSSVPLDKLGLGIMGMAFSLGALVVAIKYLTNGNDQILKVAGGMIFMSIAVRILASAVKAFGEMDWLVLVQGILGVGAMLFILNKAMQGMPDNMPAVGAGILLLSIGLIALSAALKILSTIGWVELGLGMGALGGSLFMIAAAVKELPATMPLIGAGLMMVSLGMIAIAAALKIAATIDIFSMATAVLGLGTAIAAIGIACKYMGLEGAAGAAGMLLASVALLAIAGAVKILSTISWEELGPALLALTLSLMGLAAACNLMINAIPGAAALLLASVALLALGGAMALIGSLGVEKVLVALAGIAGVLLLFTALGPGLAVALAPLAGFAGSLLLLSVAGIAASIALRMIADAIYHIIGLIDDIIMGISERIATVIDTIRAALGINSPSTVFAEIGTFLIEGLIQGITGAFQGVFDAFGTFIQGIIDFVKGLFGVNSPSTVFSEIGTFLIEGLINGISSMFGNVGEILSSLGSSALETIGGFFEGFLTGGVGWIQNVVSGIGSKAGEVIGSVGTMASGAASKVGSFASQFSSKAKTLMGNVASGFSSKAASVKSKVGEIINGALTKAGSFASNFKTKGGDLISGLINGIGSKLSDIKSKMSEIVNGALGKVNEFKESFTTAGANLSGGLLSGLKSKLSAIAQAAREVVSSALGAANSEADSHSPSRKMIKLGRFMDEGLIIGMDAMASSVSAAGKRIAQSAMASVSSLGDEMQAAVGDGISVRPNITPIVDMSGVGQMSTDLATQLQSGINGAIGLQTNRSINVSDDVQVDTERLVNVMTGMYVAMQDYFPQFAGNKYAVLTDKTVSGLTRTINRRLGAQLL